MLPTLAKVIENTPTLKYVIYDGDNADPKALEKIRSIKRSNDKNNGETGEGGDNNGDNDRGESVKVLTLDEIREMGKKNKVDPVPPKEDGELSGMLPLFTAYLIAIKRETAWKKLTQLSFLFNQTSVLSCTHLEVQVLPKVSFFLIRISALLSRLFISYSFTFFNHRIYMLVSGQTSAM